MICINKLRFVTDNLLYELEIHRKSSPFSSRPKFDIDWLNRDKRFSRISHRKRFIHIPWYAVFAVPNDRKSSIDAKYDERTIYTKYDAVYGTGNFGIIFNNMYRSDIVRSPQNFKKISHFFEIMYILYNSLQFICYYPKYILQTYLKDSTT